MIGRGRERREMHARLAELEREYREHPYALRALSDFQFYAAIGKDRRRLGMEWARQAEDACRSAVEFEHRLERLASRGTPRRQHSDVRGTLGGPA